MKWNSMILATAFLVSTQVTASVIRIREQALQERTVEVVEATATTLTDLAEELSLDLLCLALANPLVVFLTKGQKIKVPLACCGTSCQGPLCSQRTQCQGQSTASKGTGTATVIITTSLPATSTSTTSSTRSLSSITTSTAVSPSSSSSVLTTLITSTSSSAALTTTSSSSAALTTTTSSSTTTTSSSSAVLTSISTSISSSSTSTTSTSSSQAAATSITPGKLPLAFVNNFSAGNINAYITGTDTQGNIVFVKSDGTFFTPASGQDVPDNVAIPLGAQGSTTQITTPGYVVSGRIWFAQGTLKFSVQTGADGKPALVEPSVTNPQDASAGINWGFVEFDYEAATGVYANLSFVDFVGLLLGMQLTNSDGTTQIAKGLQQNSVSNICGSLKSQGQQDGQPWGNLCENDSNGRPIRVLSPTDYLSINGSAFATYWNSYVDQVWTKYTSQPLNIVTTTAGTVACKVQNDVLTCGGGDNRGYAKPNALDIFGCNTGPFAIQGGDTTVHKDVVARLCAAFDRTTLLLNGGDTQPSLDSSNFYTVEPTNYYSKFVHQNEIDGKGYAFAYDDVTPVNGENESGVVSNASPSQLTIYVGGSTS